MIVYQFSASFHFGATPHGMINNLLIAHAEYGSLCFLFFPFIALEEKQQTTPCSFNQTCCSLSYSKRCSKSNEKIERRYISTEIRYVSSGSVSREMQQDLTFFGGNFKLQSCQNLLSQFRVFDYFSQKFISSI